MALFPAANAPRFVFKAGGLEMMVAAFTIEESISQPFTAELELASEEEVPFEAVVGKPALLDLQSPQGDRCLHGIVARFVQTGATGRFFTYKARSVGGKLKMGAAVTANKQTVVHQDSGGTVITAPDNKVPDWKIHLKSKREPNICGGKHATFTAPADRYADRPDFLRMRQCGRNQHRRADASNERSITRDEDILYGQVCNRLAGNV